MNEHLARLTFLERRLDPAFEKRVISVAPGRSRAYDELEWQDTLVIVERGKIELESMAGVRRRFGRGDVLWLAGLPLRVLRNRGVETAVLVAVSRRLRGSSDEFRADPPSYWVNARVGRVPDEQEVENVTADHTPRAGRREWIGLAPPSLLLPAVDHDNKEGSVYTSSQVPRDEGYRSTGPNATHRRTRCASS